MKNLIIITTSKEIPGTIKICKIGRYLGKTGDREVEAGGSLGGMEEMEHICQLTLSLYLLQPVFKAVYRTYLTILLIWMITVRFSWNF